MTFLCDCGSLHLEKKNGNRRKVGVEGGGESSYGQNRNATEKEMIFQLLNFSVNIRKFLDAARLCQRQVGQFLLHILDAFVDKLFIVIVHLSRSLGKCGSVIVNVK